MYYVYHLIDPRDNSVFYVGKGARDRIEAHESEARRGSEHPKCARIRDIWSAGLQVVRVKVSHFRSEKAAYDFEAKEVARIGLENLTNLIPGGGGLKPLKDRKQEPAEDLLSSEDVARMLINRAAMVAVVKSRGQRFVSKVTEELGEYLLTRTIKKLWMRFGTEFMKSEFAKYGIEATFPDEAIQVQA